MNEPGMNAVQTGLQIESMRARRAIAALWAYFGVLAASFFGEHVLLGIAAANRTSIKGLPFTSWYTIIEGLTQTVSAIVVAILFLMWLHRYFRNLHEMGVVGLQFSPGWAVGWFFVPVMHFYKPYQIMREMWLAGSPRNTLSNWRQERPPLQLMWWFLLTVATQLLAVTSQLGSVPGFGPGWSYKLFFSIAGLGLLIHLIHELDRRLRAKAQASSGQALPNYRQAIPNQ